MHPTTGKRIRGLLRPLAGRESRLWRRLPFPRLRYRMFNDQIDCIIHGLLVSRRSVSFIQIGAHDGRTQDPLWTFRKYPNWSGLLVEAAHTNFEQLRRNYQPWPDRFTFENAAVTTYVGSAQFFELRTADDQAIGADQLGSLNAGLIENHIRNLPVEDARVVTSRVTCLTWDALCAKHGVKQFELLNVNAEGADLDILRQIDLNQYRPSLIKYEHSFLSQDERAAAKSLLGTAGYETAEIRTNTVAVLTTSLGEMPAFATAWRTCTR